MRASLHPVIDFMRVRKGCVGEFTEQEILDIRRTYYAMIAELDAMVGQLLDKVDELGLADSTYVIYISDHGEMNMEHRQHLKNALYEPSARVPVIVRGPGVQRGAVVDDLVSLIDVYPTLMDLARIDTPPGLSGLSLMPELTGSKAEGRPDWAFSEYHSNFQNTSSFMLRQGDLKYVAYPGYAPQLFNLADDPDEIHDLAQTSPTWPPRWTPKLRTVVDYTARRRAGPPIQQGQLYRVARRGRAAGIRAGHGAVLYRLGTRNQGPDRGLAADLTPKHKETTS